MRCSNCGEENSNSARFCGKCGKPLIVVEKDKPKKKINATTLIISSLVVVICVLAGVLFKVAGFDLSIVINKNNSQVSQNSNENSNSNNSNDSSNKDNSNDNNDSSNNDTDTQQHTLPQRPAYVKTEPKTSVITVVDEDCSSILHDSFKKDYGPYKVLDGDKSTTWSEGVDGYGYGEYITLYFDGVYNIKQLKIVNGLVNNYNAYYKNNRAKTLNLYFSDGSEQKIYLDDDTTSYQTVDIYGGVKSSYVQISIDSVYPGTKYNDTCISEVQVLGY